VIREAVEHHLIFESKWLTEHSSTARETVILCSCGIPFSPRPGCRNSMERLPHRGCSSWL